MIGPEIKTLNHLIHRFIQNSPHIAELDRTAGTYGWIIGYIGYNKGRDLYQKDLEKEFCISRSGASRAIGFLEGKGLVRREAVPEDARLKKLVLTEAGQEMNQGIHGDFERLNSALTRDFSPEERNQLLDFLHRMQNNLKET